jgi:hypothetical protein
VSVKRDAENYTPVIWLERAVPLATGHRLMVHGVANDAPKGLKRYWLQLGRAAARSKA